MRVFVCVGVRVAVFFLFLNFIFYVNVSNDLIKKITNYKKKRQNGFNVGESTENV